MLDLEDLTSEPQDFHEPWLRREYFRETLDKPESPEHMEGSTRVTTIKGSLYHS